MSERDMLVLANTYGPPDAGRYVRLPLEVPAGLESLAVTYSYPHGAGAAKNVIDIGLLDEAGRVRGWSGSARRRLRISLSTATPGYRAGPLRPGRWAVVLGLYRIQHPLEVSVVVRFSPKKRVLLAGDFHLHTVHSDGADTTAEVAARCEKAGLDAIAFTDHNCTEQNFDLPRDRRLVVLSGMEYTNYRGHASFLFPDAHARFDEDPFSNSFEEMVALFGKARARGALICINHPMCGDCPWTFPWEGVPYDVVEIWNGLMKASEIKAIAWWHERLARGERVPVMGGSDTHRLGPLRGYGGPTTFLQSASRAPADILDALRAGRSFITCAPDGPTLDCFVGDAHIGEVARPGSALLGRVAVKRVVRGDVVKILNAAEKQEWRAPRSGDFSARFRVRPEPGFYRVEVWRELSAGVSVLMALSNPVYVREPSRA